MRCDVVTLFPELIEPVLQQSMLKRAQSKGLLEVCVHRLRAYTSDRHQVVDDAPYGGGPGMVIKAEPVFRVIDALRQRYGDDPAGSTVRLVMPSPQGRRLTHQLAQELADETRRVVFLCGHYEGFDERVRIGLQPEEVSIGDYVLTGGELAALVMIDAAARLVPGVLGDLESAQCDSFADGLLDYPHYTRPLEVRGMVVPEVLVSGNHQAIERWRRKQALRNTRWKRPDLLEHKSLSEADTQLLDEIVSEGMERRSVPCLQEGVGS